MRTAAKPSLSQFFDYCTGKNLPFVYYHLPDGREVKVIAQKNSLSNKALNTKNNQKGFLFAPFREDKTCSGVIINADVYCAEDKLPVLNFAASTHAIKTKKDANRALKSASKKQFEDYVQKIRKQIRKGSFSKVVAARVIKKRKPADFEPVSYFKKLCAKYPAAFVSLVYTAEHGLWIGASPEILLSVDKKGYQTYALAGTQANTSKKGNTAWGAKEKEEQKIVSDYIVQAFKTLSKEKPLITGPETITAGNLLHLRTTFVYKSIPVAKWKYAVDQLHPTPAVAGLPKKDAIDFITQHEVAPRGFYSGYLGPVNIEGQINLFVNLRCMQVLKHKLAVHVGCGITADSNPAAEWKESKLKAATLLSVLDAKSQ